MNYKGGAGSTHSPANFKKILSDVKSNNPAIKLNGLETIAEAIAFADASQLRAFPVAESCKEFVKIVQNSSDMAILTLATQCIVNLLDTIPDASRSLMNSNYIQIVKERLQYDLSRGVLENLIHSLCALTKTRAKEVGQTVGVKFILKNLETLGGPERHYAVSALSRFTSYYSSPKFAKSLPTIAGYFNSNDEQIANQMLDTFTNIMNAISLSDVPPQVIESMCVSLAISTNQKNIIRILELLQRLIFYKPFAECLINTGLNYEVLLTSSDFGNNLPKIRLIVLQIIKSLLPSPDMPQCLWEGDRSPPPNCEKLAQEVQPILLKLALEKTGELNFVFANLAMTYQVLPSEVPNQIYHILISTSQDLKLAPFVLLLSLNLPDKQAVSATGLVTHLSKVKTNGEPFNDWYRQNITILKSMTSTQRTKVLKPSSFKKFRELLEYVNNSEMSSFELQASGYIDKLLELMRMEKNFSDIDFTKLRDRLHQILTYTNIPELIDPFEAYSSRDFANGTVLVDIKCNNKTYRHKKFENESLFVAIEAWYNESVNHVTTNDMLQAARQCGRIGQMVSLENAGSITFTHIGVLHRAFGTKKYRKFAFKMDGKKYSACDFLFQSIARSLQSPEMWPLVTPTIELIEEDTFEMLNLEVPRVNIPNKVAFELLQLIHIFAPDLDLYSIELEKTLFPHMMSFFLDISLFSPAVQIAVNYPFLFSFDFRSFVLRLISPDFFSALAFAQKAIFNTSEKLRDGRMFNHCVVSRSCLFDDGVMLMTSIAKGPLQLDISFDNEAGFGVGPTKEFFSSLAKEFTKNRTRMWRNDNNNSDDDNDNKYAWTKIGLFPRYGAKPAHFFALGVLCAKAVSMNSVLPIPFSVEFFKLIKGQKLTMEEVDSVYANSLKNHEGLMGLQFVIPGNEKKEMVKGGRFKYVTPENVEEYVKLIEDYVFGSKLEVIRQSFCDGFATVFQRGIWSMLEARELRTLISGEDVQITMKDLTEFVEISHGYESNSPQIQMLFEIICEFDDKQKSLFVKFITGSERLPIGGLESLQPHLAVAKKVDESVQNQDDALPSVMTCTNYFKLPPYSTKEKMKDKILLAINEGQGAFLLT